MTQPPLVYAFDAYGTLFDVHSVVARLAPTIGPLAERLSASWRAKQLEYSWVRTLSRAPYRDFATLTAEALDTAITLVGGIPAELRTALLRGFDRLDPYPETADTLKRLRRGGAKVAILSNGSPAMLARLIGACGLDGHLDAVLSVDAVRAFKTAPEAYGLACRTFGCPPAAISFQSANRWDIAGAHCAGLPTVWVNRSGAPDEYRDCPADRVIADLTEL
jgi:2-haloacid dehalogenase